MCFSPQMDLAAGAVVGSLGVEALRHVHRPQELPLASLPLLLGAHQLTEAFVWWGLRGQVPLSTGRGALWLYMLFAFVALPVLTPAAVLLVEPDRRRRRAIGLCTFVGALVSLTYLRAMLRGPISAVINQHTLVYRPGVSYGALIAGVYMAATVGALLSSSHRRIATFGAANVVALPILVMLTTRAVTSLWCWWAAVASVAIINQLRHGGSRQTTAERRGLRWARALGQSQFDGRQALLAPSRWRDRSGKK